MNAKDLLSLLDLKGESKTGPPTVIGLREGEAKASTVASPTALVLDAWGLRRGRDLVAESERLKTTGTDEFAAADFFAAAFEPDPQLLDECLDPLRREFLAQLFQTPSYQSLHAATRLDDTASSIAAAHFADEFHKLQHDTASSPTDTIGREMAVLRAAGRALKKAESEVEELQDAASALGLGPGAPGSNDPGRIATLFRRVRSDATLRRICELAGRYRRVAQSRQRRKVRHGLDDVMGVEMSGDIARLLPMELARLADDEFELDALRRLVERQTMCREHHGMEPVGKGPILCVVDESGSMEGEKCHTAKALALALAWIARQQRRWCGLIAYSGDTGERLLALPPGRWDEAALCDWLSAFLGGGSSLDVPLRELPEFYERIGAPRGITDVVILTDAQCRVPAADRDAFLRWKASLPVRVLTLVIDNPPGDLAALSDEVYTVASLAADGEAIGRVLSV